MAVVKGRINISRMAEAITEELKDFGYVAQEVVNKAIDATADEVAKKVQSAAPVRAGGTGPYKKSITSGFSKTNKDKHSKTVYADAPHYRLTHLVEKGHASRNGGRVNPSPEGGHWAPADSEAPEILIKKIKEGLS